MLLLVGSSITLENCEITVSFCISSRSSRSAANSKNSHSTPTVMEKQKAARARNAGERWKWAERSRFRMSTKP